MEAITALLYCSLFKKRLLSSIRYPFKKEYLQENYHTGYKEEENTLLWFPKFFHIRQEELPNIILSLEDIMLVMKKQNRFYKVQAGGRLMLFI